MTRRLTTPPPCARVVIVGGGFSGAAHRPLARRAALPLDIDVVEPREASVSTLTDRIAQSAPTASPPQPCCLPARPGAAGPAS